MNMNKSRLMVPALLATTLLTFNQAGLAAAAGDTQTDHPAGHAVTAESSTVQGVGVVQSIDATAGTVTLAHEPIPALNWPAMTMPFKIAENALENAKVGEKVEFELSGEGNDVTITKMEKTE